MAKSHLLVTDMLFVICWLLKQHRYCSWNDKKKRIQYLGHLSLLVIPDRPCVEPASSNVWNFNSNLYCLGPGCYILIYSLGARQDQFCPYCNQTGQPHIAGDLANIGSLWLSQYYRDRYILFLDFASSLPSKLYTASGWNLLWSWE